MHQQLAPERAGRLAGALFVGSGVISLITSPLVQSGSARSAMVALVGALAIALGAGTLAVPWDRLHPRTPLLLFPPALVLIAVGNHVAETPPATYSVFLVIAYIWVGLSQPPRVALWTAPLAVAAYAAPLVARGDQGLGGLTSTLTVVPGCVFIAEAIAWARERERRSVERRSSIASVATALGPQLDPAELCQTLVHDVRTALHASAVTFVLLDGEQDEITEIYHSSDQTAGRIDGLGWLREQRIDGSRFLSRLSDGEPLVIDDSRDLDGALGLIADPSCQSHLVVPVMARERVIGVLLIGSGDSAPSYTDRDTALARALAVQVGAALQNALLYDRTQATDRLDPLTSLGNRTAFFERLDAEMRRARTYERPLGLLLLDLDDLRRINEEAGHLAGDRAITEAASQLDMLRRAHDSLFRIAGDEFAVVLPETDRKGTAQAAERMRAAIESAAIGTDLTKLTASVGAGAFPDHATASDELQERVEAAVLRVTRSGGNGVAVATARDARGPGIRVGVDVRKIIDGAHVVPMYRSVVSLGDGGMVGYAATCVVDAALGDVPPAALFSAAGTMGLAAQLDVVCQRATMLNAHGLGASERLFMRVAPAAVDSVEFDLPGLRFAALESGLMPEQLVLELGREERNGASDRLIRNLLAARHSGFGLALAGFGSITNDLALLAQVRVDFVALEVRDREHGVSSGSDERLRAGLVAAAADAGAMPVATHIDTPADLELAQRLGFAAATGYHIAIPSPILNPPLLGPRQVVCGTGAADRRSPTLAASA